MPKGHQTPSTTQREAEVLAEVMPAGRLNSNDSEATEVQTREVGGTNRRGRRQRAAKPQSRVEVEETPPGVRDPQHQEGGAEGHL